MNLIIASHSSRVTFPSLFVSWLSKNPWNAFSASARDNAPSLSVSRSLSIESYVGICISLSSAPLDEPAKKRLPSAATGDEQQAAGMPLTDHFSAPVVRSYPIMRACPAATTCLPAALSHPIGVQYEARDSRGFCHLSAPVVASTARIFGSFISSRTRTAVRSKMMGETPLPKPA